MNLDETFSPSAKRSRNHAKAHRGKLRKQAPTEDDDDDEEAEEEEEEEEEDEEKQRGQNGLNEDDTAGAEDVKRSSSFWQTHHHQMTQQQKMQEQASRIFRVSRASGGKDRHSKVLTAKGLRDRRVRLSVSTAIQFYDLQDRLGYDQPSKAVDWLIKAAADAISELPSLDGTFPNPALLREPDLPAATQPSLSVATNLTRSACSSTSETSRSSLLSLSRSETRVKARERTKEKEKVVSVATAASEEDHPSQTTPLVLQQHNHQTRNTSSSFTELLMDCNNQQNHNQGFLYKAQSKLAMVVKKAEPPSLPNLDYFSPNAVSAFSSGQAPANKMNVMALPAHFANAAQLMSIAPLNGLGFVDHHPELQQFAFSQEHHIPVAANSNDYSLNFSMSSFSADSNRGTLQSNSSVLLPHHHFQRLSSTLTASEGSAASGLPFLIGAVPATAGAAEGQFPPGFDARLQLYYNDGSRQSDLKGKGKG